MFDGLINKDTHETSKIDYDDYVTKSFVRRVDRNT